MAVDERARLSAGTSLKAVYEMIANALTSRHSGGGMLVDVGCGCGHLWPYVADRFDRYCGADVVLYEGFPSIGEFHCVDLDTGRVPLDDGVADIVTAIETIEHLENPRAFVRELTRLAKPGGWVLVTTPNNLSLLSKFTLLWLNEFNAFRAGNYPAHLTALIEVDLRRMAGECGWDRVTIEYTRSGRIPGSARHWPKWVSRLSPRSFSDNVLVIGQKSG
jgi:SAM-dependent methyltransferase